MNDNMFISLILVFGLVGLFFVSESITGMMVFDAYTAPVCETSKDCALPTVCCAFYQQNGGACADSSMCDAIYALRGGEIPGFGYQANNSTSILMFVDGAFMIVMIGFMLVAFSRQHTSRKHAA
jgi:hypothetical protein